MTIGDLIGGALIIALAGTPIVILGIGLYDISGDREQCAFDNAIEVVEVGGCESDRNGYGSCGSMLSNGQYARLEAPVKGEKLVQCTVYNREGKVKNVRYKRK